jgi:hypothetical protein
MYRALTGTDIWPIEPGVEWREQLGRYEPMIAAATRQLTRKHKILPIGNEGDEYIRRRYVCGGIPGLQNTCYSIGLRDPFKGHKTPIWMRFHKKTGQFQRVHANLHGSRFAPDLVESGGHIWIPLVAPDGADGNQQVAALVARAGEVAEAAFVGISDST